MGKNATTVNGTRRQMRSQRLTDMAIPLIVVGIAVIIFLTSAAFTFLGIKRYERLLSMSSTQIGTTLTFNRSGVDVKLEDVYTDETESVLIARIGGSSMTQLPYKGTSYAVIVQCDKLKGDGDISEMSIRFGKLGTDGDMFLIIPKPIRGAVYNVIIVNTNYVAYSPIQDERLKNDNDIDTSRLSDENVLTLAQSISNYEYNERADEGNSLEIENNFADAIGFRLALEPAIENDSYKPKVVQGTLYNEETGEFDYETFFMRIFKENAKTSLLTRFATISESIDALQPRIDELTERVEYNPDDANAVAALEAAEKEVDELKSEQLDITEQVSILDSMTYSELLFSNLQTTAYLVNDMSAVEAAAAG